MVARLDNLNRPLGASDARDGAVPAKSVGAGDDIKRLALSGLFWAMVQNWVGKGLSLLLFLILARLLTPAELGVAAAINVVIVFISLIAEQGFSDAIVQRRNLQDRDINLPFFTSLSISSVLALTVVLLSTHIEQWMNIAGLAPLLSVAAATLPLAAMTMFQEALYRRQLLFKQVAVRMLLTSTIAGIVAVACAYAGMGSWSLVIQALVMSGLNVLWLWHKPLWRPSLALQPESYRQIANFSGSVLAARVSDLVGTRSVELLIAALHGPVALGLYAVGAKVFQTVMQLLSTGTSTVSLGAMAHVAEDVDRLARAYMKTVMASAAIAVPIFILIAATSHEWALLLFGKKWEGSGEIMQVLMLLGALQCVQFTNGATFGALGHPRYVAWTAALKAGAAIIAIALVPTDNVVELTVVFALSQLAATPMTYVWLSRCLRLKLTTILVGIVPFYVAATCGYLAAHVGRTWIAEAEHGPLFVLLVLSLLYALVYWLIILSVGRGQLRQVWQIFRR